MQRVAFSVFAFFMLAFSSQQVTAQTEEDEKYSKEVTYGINLNTNAGLIGGAMLRLTKPKAELLSTFYYFEIVEVKHPKEIRITGSDNQSTFVAGKSNYLFAIRPQYGYEYTLFKKAAEQGVQVSVLGAGGPTIGLLKPYYIYYDYHQGSVLPALEQYDPAKHTSFGNIVGPGGVFTRFGTAKIQPGLSLRGAICFEYGQYQERLAGIEVGFVVEQFAKKQIILPESFNKSTFTSLYLTLYTGSRN